MQRPTPHLEKLTATLANEKLPASDKLRVNAAIDKYKKWISALAKAEGARSNALVDMVQLLTEYKKYVDLELIFDSPNDFLYRQKGQLKLDNSIIEEFLPWLINKSLFPELPDLVKTGPTKCYSALYFDTTINSLRAGGGITVRTKDQDFALSRKLYIKASHSSDYTDSAEVNTHIAYVATEVKTNLDKTMFQEACATARDLRIAVPSARYFLMCEWLDMTPISTGPTDIEKVYLLRRGKRINSNVRKKYSEVNQRKLKRSEYSAYLDAHPFHPDVFESWTQNIKAILFNEIPVEDDVIQTGYF